MIIIEQKVIIAGGSGFMIIPVKDDISIKSEYNKEKPQKNPAFIFKISEYMKFFERSVSNI